MLCVMQTSLRSGHVSSKDATLDRPGESVVHRTTIAFGSSKVILVVVSQLYLSCSLQKVLVVWRRAMLADWVITIKADQRRCQLFFNCNLFDNSADPATEAPATERNCFEGTC